MMCHVTKGLNKRSYVLDRMKIFELNYWNMKFISLNVNASYMYELKYQWIPFFFKIRITSFKNNQK